MIFSKVMVIGLTAASALHCQPPIRLTEFANASFAAFGVDAGAELLGYYSAELAAGGPAQVYTSLSADIGPWRCVGRRTDQT